jgi:hypothetical protein
MVVWGERGSGGDEGAAVVVWCGGLVGGWAWTMAGGIGVCEVGVGLGTAVSSLISVGHLSGFECVGSESGWAARTRCTYKLL